MKREIKLAILHHLTLFRQSVKEVFGVESQFHCIELDHDGALLENLDRERPDLVLVELGLPDDRAIELTRYAHRCEWDLKIIVLVSSEFNERQVTECVAAEAHGWVHEASSLDDLRVAIDDALNGRRFCSYELVKVMFAHLSHRIEPPKGPKAGLTERESEVLDLISRGMSNQEIAKALSVSLSTIKHHVHHILEKLNVDSRYQAVNSVRGLNLRGPRQDGA